ncbi:MAG: hypothetical protein AAGA80_06175 [Cyanobacteria bacterium P01_F01_bin.143]
MKKLVLPFCDRICCKFLKRDRINITISDRFFPNFMSEELESERIKQYIQKHLCPEKFES